MDIKDIKGGEGYLVWCEEHELHAYVIKAKVVSSEGIFIYKGEYISPEYLYPLDGSYWLCDKWWEKGCSYNCEHKIPHLPDRNCSSRCERDSICLPITEENIPKLFREEDTILEDPEILSNQIDKIHKRLDELEGKNQPLDFMECPECAKKLGSPILCPACLNNRQLISDLKKARE